MACLTNLIAFLNIDRYESISSAYNALKNKSTENIRVVCEFDNPSDQLRKSRFLLNTIHKGLITLTIHSEANGIVLLCDLDAEFQWSVLVMPPRTLTTKYNKRKLISNIKSYTISPMNDGTIISLYYYDNKWRISTTRGYDMGPNKWLSTKTYDEIIAIVLAKYDISFDELDSSSYYTIGFHHPEYHPFVNDITAWSINFVDESKKGIGKLPQQLSVTFPKNFTNEQIFNALQNNNYGAMANYITSGKIHYGYILRYNDSNILLESDLFQNIKYIYYKHPKIFNERNTENINKQLLDPTTRNLFVALRAYMNPEKKYVALSLFSHFKELYSSFDEMISEAALNVLLKIQDNKLQIKSSLNNVITLVSNHITLVGGFDPQASESKSIAMDFLTDPRYIYAYLNYLSNK